MNKLPSYEMIIDESPESGVEVSFVALVEKPAIEKNFMAFKDMTMNFAADPERRIISGPAMVADSLIYRRDESGEYNVFFSKETIHEIALKFFKKDYQKNLNLFHDPALSLEGVTIFESFVSDKSRGIQPMKGFEDLPDGTWFISAKVENQIVWDKIKSGEVKGFSVEGIFSYLKKPKEGKMSLNGTESNLTHLFEKDFMAKINDVIANFKKKYFEGTPLVAPVAPVTAAVPVAPAVPSATVKPQVLNSDYTLKDGTTVTIDMLEVGGVVLVAGVPAPAGEHELSDGTKVTVGEGGVITAVSTVEAAQVAPPVTMADVEAAIMKAITLYKEEMAKSTDRGSELAGVIKRLDENAVLLSTQNDKIAGLFGIVEKMADTPTSEPIGEVQKSFSTQKNEAREIRLKSLVENIKKLKTA